MICELCKQEKLPKSNTHYLTDAIIRDCINADGYTGREKGLYFGISNKGMGLEFNFQKSTPVDSIEQVLGRAPSEEEIEKAKQNPYSVNDKFCIECEQKFTKIETKFIEKYYHPLFRKRCFVQEKLNKQDALSIRLFFLLQIWRSAICVEHFVISDKIKKSIRNIISTEDFFSDRILDVPLYVAYLATPEDDYSTNFVDLRSTKEYSIIFMNDFIIACVESRDEIANDDKDILQQIAPDYKNFINFQCDNIQVQFFSENERKKILEKDIASNVADNTINNWFEIFSQLWRKFTQTDPCPEMRMELVRYILQNAKNNPQAFLEKEILHRIAEFTFSKLNK